MKTEIEKAGLKVNLVVVNLIGTQDAVANLIANGDYPILQDTDAAKVWDLHGAGKDDMIIYSKTGKLTSYYPYGGAIYTALSDLDAYALIKQKWVDADKAP